MMVFASLETTTGACSPIRPPGTGIQHGGQRHTGRLPGGRGQSPERRGPADTGGPQGVADAGGLSPQRRLVSTPVDTGGWGSQRRFSAIPHGSCRDDKAGPGRVGGFWRPKPPGPGTGGCPAEPSATSESGSGVGQCRTAIWRGWSRWHVSTPNGASTGGRMAQPSGSPSATATATATATSVVRP